MLRKRDLRFVRRQAILMGALRPPDVEQAEVVDALREEVLELRRRLAELEGGSAEQAPARATTRLTPA